MTLREKADFVAGHDMWHTGALERLGIPAMKLTDGPNGARGVGLLGTGTPTACIPSGAVLGATWDPGLVEELGRLLGEEARAKQAHVLLAPTINLHRSPKGGRNFECYSEDPLLTARLAAAFVRGVQSTGVAATPKHFVANDSEFERNTIDVQADERTLRETSLLPFEAAVRDGGAWALMSAYNRLNGAYCSEHEWLLRTVLRDQWGFDGMVVTDWFANGSTAGNVKAGLSLEMPGPPRLYGDALFEALQSGEVAEADVDALVDDLLALMQRTGLFDAHGDDGSGPNGHGDGPGGQGDGQGGHLGLGGGLGDGEETLDRPEDRELMRAAAAAGSVLLRNDGLLPLDFESIGSLAVIGPNARQARVMGGGSANVRAYRESSPLDALAERYPHLSIRYAPGADIDRTTAPISAPLLDGPVRIEFRNGHDFAGPAVYTATSGRTALRTYGKPAEGVDSDRWCARAAATLLPEVSGEHRLSLTVCGRAAVRLDGAVVIDATADDLARGDAFFGLGSAEIGTVVSLEAGKPVELTVDFDNRHALLLAGFVLGAKALVERDLPAEAAALAAECDAALVVVGTNDDWETEGRDRDLWELPGEQPELISKVAAANPRTVVVLNVGSPHCVDWLDQPAAVLSVGFAGQELGEAVVDMLSGAAEPGGRSPTTIGRRYEHFAALANYPGHNSTVRYGEGVWVGHRWHDAMGIEPAVPFGFGLGYTSFAIGEPAVGRAAEGRAAATQAQTGDEMSVAVEVANTGDRRGSEVVQLYVEPLAPAVARPLRELKDFAKVTLEPGESATVRFDLGPRAFAYFDPADPAWDELGPHSSVPASTRGLHRSEPGWYVDPGVYRIVVGRSSRHPAGTVDVELTGDPLRLAP